MQIGIKISFFAHGILVLSIAAFDLPFDKQGEVLVVPKISLISLEDLNISSEPEVAIPTKAESSISPEPEVAIPLESEFISPLESNLIESAEFKSESVVSPESEAKVIIPPEPEIEPITQALSIATVQPKRRPDNLKFNQLQAQKKPSDTFDASEIKTAISNHIAEQITRDIIENNIRQNVAASNQSQQQSRSTPIDTSIK